MAIAENVNNSIPFYKSVVAKVLFLTFCCTIFVSFTVKTIAWRSSINLANSAVSGQVQQVSAMLGSGESAGIRFGDKERLVQKLDDAILHSDGQISGGIFVDANGNLLASAGTETPNLMAAALESLAKGKPTQMGEGRVFANPSLNSGTIVGAISLSSNPSSLLVIAKEGTIWTVVFGFVALIFGLAVSFYALRTSLWRSLAGLVDSMSKISRGVKHVEIGDQSRQDEIGQFARNLEDFRVAMEQNAATIRQNLFRSSAFSDTTSAMMMIDRDLVIIDQNRACEELIAEHSQDFSEFHPGFDFSNLRGVSVEKFHKNPARLRSFLSDSANFPFVADITIGNLMLEQKISAITSDEGAHLGSILEWRDVGKLRLHSGILDVIDQKQCLIEYSPTGRIVNVNERACACFGGDKATLVGKSFEDLLDPTENKGPGLFQTIREGTGFVGKLRRKGEDDREIWVDASINLILDGNGKPLRIVEISADISTQEIDARRNEKEKFRMIADQETVVEELKQGLKALAEGDLCFGIKTEFADDYEQLRIDFNFATSKLHQSLNQLRQVASNVQEGTQEISQASDDLSRRTESQAATLANTASAMDELTMSVKSSANGAATADSSASVARSSAKAGGEIVLEAVEAMKEIEISSTKIGQIIGVIDDIAFQTNLLALNAGVEAARAGDAGRGFAVVASEVRALSQRSSGAAHEIKELISASSLHVGKGVELVDKTGLALLEIVESVENIAVQVSEIAASSHQQAEGLDEINQGMNRLDAVTQQNAAMVEESTAASHAMRNEADALSETISFFSTRDNNSGTETAILFDRSKPKIGKDAPTSGTLVADKPISNMGMVPGHSLSGLALSALAGQGAHADQETQEDDWQDF